MLNTIKNVGSMACQVMTNIRCKKEISYQEMTDIFKQNVGYDSNVHDIYFIGFFEECRPNMIKQFMREQDITRNQIMNIYDKVANFGETHKFREAVQNGEF